MHSLFSIAYGKQQFITNLLSKHNSCTFTVINLYTISKLCSWSIVPVIRNLLLIYKLCVTGRMDSSCLHHWLFWHNAYPYISQLYKATWKMCTSYLKFHDTQIYYCCCYHYFTCISPLHCELLKLKPGVKVGGNAWEHCPRACYFCNLTFLGLKERFFCRNEGRKDSFIHYQWTSQSIWIWSRYNGLTRNTGGPQQNWKGPTNFYRENRNFYCSTTLKFHVNHWLKLSTPKMSAPIW